MNSEYVTTKEEALSLVRKRIKQFDVEPLAILLHGSRASGNSYTGSDWDFYVLAVFDDRPVRPEFIYKNSFIDCGFMRYQEGMDVQEFISSSKLVPAQKFEVLWSKDSKSLGFANDVIGVLKEQYANSSRETWSDIREHWLETYFLRNIYRISECKDDLRRQIYVSLFLEQICRNQYFHFTNQWGHSISEGYKMIKKNDPSLYKLLIKLPKLSSGRAIKLNLTKIYKYFTKLDKENPSTMGTSIYAKQGSRLQE